MCEFVSWIASGDRVYFLTKKDFATKRGMELRKYLGTRFTEDIMGHGAIRFFFELPNNKGRNEECTDFSDPSNFPLDIQDAIKNGQFEGIGIAEGILTVSSLKRYYAKADATYADSLALQTAENGQYSEYQAKCNSLFWSIAKVKRNRVKAWNC